MRYGPLTEEASTVPPLALCPMTRDRDLILFMPVCLLPFQALINILISPLASRVGVSPVVGVLGNFGGEPGSRRNGPAFDRPRIAAISNTGCWKFQQEAVVLVYAVARCAVPFRVSLFLVRLSHVPPRGATCGFPLSWVGSFPRGASWEPFGARLDTVMCIPPFRVELCRASAVARHPSWFHSVEVSSVPFFGALPSYGV